MRIEGQATKVEGTGRSISALSVHHLTPRITPSPRSMLKVSVAVVPYSHSRTISAIGLILRAIAQALNSNSSCDHVRAAVIAATRIRKDFANAYPTASRAGPELQETLSS